MDFILLVTYALLAGVVSAVFLSLAQGEKMDSLNLDENGKLNPMLPWWIGLSLIHVGIVYGWAYLLYYLNVIKLYEKHDPFWLGLLFFFSYWAIFESWYWMSHRLQHYSHCFGTYTGHKGGLSEKFHHGMKAPYGPDFLTAFSAHPVDDFIVQQAAQMPWILSHLLGMITGKYFKISYLTYGITLSWLVFIGMRAHTRHSFGGSNHCKHHDDPSHGPYSFSGIPEGVYDVVMSKLFPGPEPEQNLVPFDEL